MDIRTNVDTITITLIYRANTACPRYECQPLDASSAMPRKLWQIVYGPPHPALPRDLCGGFFGWNAADY